jgi:hypothetical protein
MGEEAAGRRTDVLPEMSFLPAARRFFPFTYNT